MAHYTYKGEPIARNDRPGQPVLPPKNLPGFPDAVRVKFKTARPGGGLRTRWKDGKGQIYEWDYQHGRVEVYDSHGNHLGEYDPNSGHRVSGPVRGRKVTP